MWHWLPNLQLKKHRFFWFRLALFSFLGHVILLLIALFSHKRASVNLVVFAKPRAIEVIFMPLYKKIPMAQNRINQAKFTSSSSEASSKKTGKTVLNKKIPVKSLPSKQMPSKKVNKSKVPAKKELEKKEPKEKVSAKKITPKKNDLKLKEQVIKIAPVVQPVMAPEVSELVETAPIYIGRQDLKDLQMFGELQAILLQNWQPPVGFGADVECVVELVVGLDGEIGSLVIKKSSNILAYDLSVKRNFNGMILPASAANKTFTIVFKP